MNKSIALTGYADCFSGISGDMFLGALLHCGFPEEVLRTELAKLNLKDFSLDVVPTKLNGIGAIKVDITPESNQQLRHLHTIVDILEKSDLSSEIIIRAKDVFTLLAQAEAKVHDIDIERVHFHEVGAIDTIIDIVGVLCGLHYLGIEKLVSAPLPSPRGFVNCDHGRLPLPAPAVCELMEGIPTYGVDIQKEMVTPTGAALIKSLASDYGNLPPMTITATGYGAGTSKFSDNQPNLFRFIYGTAERVDETQLVEIIETNLDDWSPEGFQHLCDTLLSQGALDVNLTPIQVKKGRPGFKIQIICAPHLSFELRNILFTETTAIGVRLRKERRHTLPRKIVHLLTDWGEIQAKEVQTPDGIRLYPEYESCRKAAIANDVPLLEIYEAVRKKTKP